MKFIAVGALAIVVILPGAVALLAPGTLISFSQRLIKGNGIYFIAGVRLVIGIVLWFSADYSSDPSFIQGLAVVIFVAGILTILLKRETFKKMIGWFFSWPLIAIRAWGLLALLLGTLLIRMYV